MDEQDSRSALATLLTGFDIVEVDLKCNVVAIAFERRGHGSPARVEHIGLRVCVQFNT